MMPFWGQIAEVDLNTGKSTLSPYPVELTWKILGGRGFNAWFLYHHVAAGIDPLSGDNVLLFSCGALTGTQAPASSRIHVGALSPLTGRLGSSNVGGDFGTRLRTCGIQSLIIKGRSQAPVYLRIDQDGIELLDARFLRGLDTWETRARLRSRYEDHPAGAPGVVCIGPGGENQARFACIMAEGDHAAGRTGLGAVMGSKNLKAIAVHGGSKPVPAKTRGPARAAVKHYLRQITRSPEFRTLSTYGGAGYVKWADDLGILCTRNYRENRFEGIDRLDGRRLNAHVTRRKGCERCPVKCKAELRYDLGKHRGLKGTRPEFEPMIALGSKCGLSDPMAVTYLDNLCSRMGLDNISAGGAIAFAMDVYDRGILCPEDTQGLDLVWGNVSAMETLILQMARREGLGAVLSQGVRKAASLLGKGAERYAPHVKGLELSGYHPFEIMATALGYAVSNRGGDFNDVYASLEYRIPPDAMTDALETPVLPDLRSVEGKGYMVRHAMLVSVILDCLGLCKVPALSLIGRFDLENEAALLSGLTGWDMDPQTLFVIGERIVTLERLFNFKQGFDGFEDRLPDMFFHRDYTPGEEPSPSTAWMEPMKAAFYRSMGWDERGWPKEKKLKELGLWDVWEWGRVSEGKKEVPPRAA